MLSGRNVVQDIVTALKKITLNCLYTRVYVTWGQVLEPLSWSYEQV